MDVSNFDYDLPEEAIAQSAVEPRHNSRLLDTRDMSDHLFVELADLLDPDDLVVVNDTRVRAARLLGHRADTGGQVELLLLESGDDGVWEALARPARRLRPGVVLQFADLDVTVVRGHRDGIVGVRLETDEPEEAVIERLGTVPLPPYFSGSLSGPERYQTIFATSPGSAAAPTAGLHFTADVVESLRHRGIRICTVDLHVSLDTFRPMSGERVEDHHMHSEWCSVPVATAHEVSETRLRDGRVVAIGTTVVRALETFAGDDGRVRAGSAETALFLLPGYDFRVVDALITNFHLPSSTLLVLLAAFMGPTWRVAYATALRRGYRFLSFGDAMLTERGGVAP